MNSVHNLPTDLPTESPTDGITDGFVLSVIPSVIPLVKMTRHHFFLLCFNFFSHGNSLGIYWGNISVGKIPQKFTDGNIPSVFPFVFINFLVVFNVINKSLIYFVYYEEYCNLFLGPRTKKEKIQKNQKYMFEKTQKIYNSKTRMSKRSNMVKTWLRFKNTKIKIWQYFVDRWETCWQIKFNMRKKSPKSNVYGLN